MLVLYLPRVPALFVLRIDALDRTQVLGKLGVLFCQLCDLIINLGIGGSELLNLCIRLILVGGELLNLCIGLGLDGGELLNLLAAFLCQVVVLHLQTYVRLTERLLLLLQHPQILCDCADLPLITDVELDRLVTMDEGQLAHPLALSPMVEVALHEVRDRHPRWQNGLLCQLVEYLQICSCRPALHFNTTVLAHDFRTTAHSILSCNPQQHGEYRRAFASASA